MSSSPYISLPQIPQSLDKETKEYLTSLTRVLTQKQLDSFSSVEVLQQQQTLAQAFYAPYYVQATALNSPQHGYLWYNTTNNKLFKYNEKLSKWVEIDWQQIIKATPEWQAGKLRIGADGILEIADGQATPTWHDCYPLIGTTSIKIQGSAVKYYLPIGISCDVTNSLNSIPIVYSLGVTPIPAIFQIIGDYNVSSGNLVISPSGVSGSGIYFALYNNNNTPQAWAGTTYGAVLSEHSNRFFCSHIIVEKNSTPYYLFSSHRGSHPSGIWQQGLIAGYVGLPTSGYYIGTHTASSIYKIIVRRVQ